MTDTPTYADTYTDIDADDGFFSHLSWGAVFAGLAVAVAIHIVLALIGIAVGMAAANPDHFQGHNKAGAIGIGEGLWYLISTLVAIFTGAAVAARIAGAVLRGDGVLHGIITWAVSLIAALLILSSAAGGIASGPFHGWAHHDGGRGMARHEAGPGAGTAPEETDPMMVDPAHMTADQARGDFHMQIGKLANNAADTAAHDRAVADLESQGVSATDANNRVEEARQHVQQAEAAAASAITWAATWAAISLILGAAAAAFGGYLGARWAAESAGLDLYPVVTK